MTQIFNSIIKHLLVNPMTTKDGYRVYSLNKHKLLKAKLEQYKFFDFHISNHGHIVSEHQIVAFFHWGYKALMNGFIATKEDINVHHINSNPNDNRPENLIYLSTNDHLLVSMLANSKILTPTITKGHTPFNRQGKPIANIYTFLTNIIRDTMRQSIAIFKPFSNIGRSLRSLFLKVPGFIKQAMNNLKEYIKKDIFGMDNFKSSPIVKLIKAGYVG
jgi:hypothetical protein